MLNDKQALAIKCAYADLVGAYQSMAAQDYSIHDWTNHLVSIHEMEEAFEFIVPMQNIEEVETD